MKEEECKGERIIEAYVIDISAILQHFTALPSYQLPTDPMMSTKSQIPNPYSSAYRCIIAFTGPWLQTLDRSYLLFDLATPYLGQLLCPARVFPNPVASFLGPRSYKC